MAESEKEELEKLLLQIDFRSLFQVITNLLEAYGDFARKIGEVQRDQRAAYEFLTSAKAMKYSMELLGKISQETPPEILGLFIQILMKLNTYLPKINKIMDISAEEKIELGENLKSLAEDLKKMQKMTEQKGEGKGNVDC
jgi:hypothetical protein